MAESYLRSLRPEWRVLSAGVSAVAGTPASANARAAVAELGLDLSAHRARPLETLEGQEFDRVLVMGPEHLAAMKEWEGDLLSSLSGERTAVPDPYGGSLAVYRRTLATLVGHLDRLASRNENA